MISPDPLDRLVEQDTFAEAMALLEPEDLLIAALRLEALSDEQIAALLDVDRATICRRMEQARQRIVEALPELAPVLRDRHYRSPRAFRAGECPGPITARVRCRPPNTKRKGSYLLRARSGR